MSEARVFDWNVICQVCRFEVKASEATKRWDGLIVGRHHDGCFEHRHPNDLPAKPVKDNPPLPFTSPPPATDTETDICSGADRSSVAGVGRAGCMVSGLIPVVVSDSVPSGTFNTSTL